MPYTIHRYPAELIEIVRGAAGERIMLRPVLPQDADLMQDFFRGLSPESRRNRFFRTLHELPSALLDRFTSIDYHDHLAFLASILVEDEEVVIGEARYVISEPGAAEFAVTIADAWHGQGIGRLLLALLEYRAAAEGITRLLGEMLPSNRAMHRLAMKLGFGVSLGEGGEGLWRLEKHLDQKRRVRPCVEGSAFGAMVAA
jgi:RimJ/RimL family protein N-acetyltransferase